MEPYWNVHPATRRVKALPPTILMVITRDGVPHLPIPVASVHFLKQSVVYLQVNSTVS